MNIALIKPFSVHTSQYCVLVVTQEEIFLSQCAEIDLISSFVIQVSKQLLPIVAVPISDITRKCVKVSGKNNDYIIKIPNNFEHH